MNSNRLPGTLSAACFSEETREPPHGKTARTWLENELRLTAERLALATDSGCIGVWEWDILSGEVGWDSRTRRLYDIDPGTTTISYGVWTETLHPEDRDAAEQELAGAVAGNSRFNTCFRVVWRDGSVHHMRAVAEVSRDDAGTALRMLGVNWDVTKEVTETLALKMATERMQLAADAGEIGILEFDLLNGLLFPDEWSCRILGFNYAVQQGLPADVFNRLVHPDDRARYDQVRQDAVDGIAPFALDFRVIRADGLIRHVKCSALITRGVGGHALRMTGSIQDITGRKTIEEALAKTVQDLAAKAVELAETARRLAIKAEEADEARSKLAIKADELAETARKLAVKAEEAEETRGKLAVKADELAETARQLAIKAEEAEEARAKLAVKADELAETAAKLAVKAEEADETRSKLAVKSDELAETTKELRRSNEELSQFASIASHDLQEPLRMVTSYVQLLSKRYKGRLDADADEFIAYAVDGTQRMKQLIQDLLAYSRVGTNGVDLRSAASEEALKRALWSLQGAIKESGAVVTHDALPVVLADASQLTQLFQNLVGNAIKYRGAEVPVIHISAAPSVAGRWRFLVRDNALGIDPEHFDRIFGMFQRLHGAGEYSGTGIGLAICKKIIDRHGGVIGVASKAGEGSTFHFTLGGAQPAGAAPVNAES